MEKRCAVIAAEDYSIKISSQLKKKNSPESMDQHFLQLEGRLIKLPDKFLPDKEFLKIHHDYFKP
jgi:hypothetical protein